MKEIICEICGKNDWSLFGDDEGNIMQIKCKNDLNLLINNAKPYGKSPLESLQEAKKNV